MTNDEIVHSAASFAPFQSWAARYSGPELVNRPDLGQWSMAPAGMAGATLTADGDALVYTAGSAVSGFIWRSNHFLRLSPGERIAIQTGDRYVLCTEAVLRAVGHGEVAKLVGADEDAPSERLVLAALAADATEAMAAITVEVVGYDHTPLFPLAPGAATVPPGI